MRLLSRQTGLAHLDLETASVDSCPSGGWVGSRLVADVHEVDAQDPATRFRFLLLADGVDAMEGKKCENLQWRGYERCPVS